MSFPAYPEYKDSGVEWLGQVPQHWSLSRIKHAAHVIMGQSPTSDSCDENASGPPFLQGNADFGRAYPTPQVFCSQPTKLARPNDLLLSVRAPVGECNIADQQYAIGRGLCALRPVNWRVTPGFFFRLLTSLTPLLDAVATGSTYKAVSTDDVENAPIPHPPLTEQQCIAAFLDRETARIDALIAEQQRLIELLNEKRQAVISHAVTKGLDPNVPMKDSGVEWLGEVPAHWSILKLKYVSPEITVGIVVEPSRYYADEGVPALRSINVGVGYIDTDNLVRISPESHNKLSKTQIYEGDLVAVRSGIPGTTAIVPPEFNESNCIDLIIIRKPRNNSEYFLSWYLGSNAAIQQIAEGSGGAIQQHFNVAKASELLVILPCQKEQHRIACYLKTKISMIDSLIKDSERSIAFLKERRAALISAAVTGKIDVRNWQPQDSASEDEALAVAASNASSY